MTEIPKELIQTFIEAVSEEVQPNGSTTVWSVPSFREQCEILGIEFEDLLTAAIREQARRQAEEDILADTFDPDEDLSEDIAEDDPYKI